MKFLNVLTNFIGSISTLGDVTLSGQASPTIALASNDASTGRTWTLISRYDGKFDLSNSGVSAVLFDTSSQATFSANLTAPSLITSTDSGISINGITMTKVAANSAIRVSDGLETLGLLRSYAALNVGTTGTFGSDVFVEDNLYLTDAGTVRGKLILNASDRDNVELRAESIGSTMTFFTAATQALSLDDSQDATFAGTVTVPAKVALGQGGGVTFGDTTAANPITIREGLVGTEGSDSDRICLYSRNSLSIFTYPNITGGTFRAGFDISGLNVVGDIQASDDLIALDSIFMGGNLYHQGDTDTFMQYTDNQINFSTGGQDVFQMGSASSSGNYPANSVIARNNFLVGAGSGGKLIGSRINYATSQGWVEDPVPFQAATGYYGGNFGRNGSTAENKIEWGLNPWGAQALIWKSINDTASNDDGGWGKNIANLPSSDVGYLSVVYVKRVGTATTNLGNFYHGCSGSHTLNLSGTANTNPYFLAIGAGNLPIDQWCVSIGLIQANTDTSTATASTDISGLYRLDTGEKIVNATRFKMKAASTTQTHRTYLYYGTDVNCNLEWYAPGFWTVDGSEPKLTELLGVADASQGPYLKLAGGTMTGATLHGDSVLSRYGTGNDMSIYHNGTDGFIQNEVGILKISAGSSIQLDDDTKLRKGTSGTSGSFIFKTTDNADESAFIRKEGYWMQLSAHQNEGFKFTDAINNTVVFQINNGNSTTGNGINSASFLGNLYGPNAFFTGDISATSLDLKSNGMIDWQNGDARIIEGEVGGYSLSFEIYNGVDALERTLLLEKDMLATFTGKVRSAQTASGDDASTLATKEYVDTLISGATRYAGTWDASGTAGGTPDLRLAANKVVGTYYICETAGSAAPNGTGTEPNTWAVGDWCIFSDLATDAWQKIDNSTVLSGSGVSGKVAVWVDTETLIDGPLEFSGNNATNAGNITAGSTTKASNTVIRSQANDDYKAGFEAYGSAQGTGYFYSGQTLNYGGGFFYNGDGSPAFPATGEGSDRISFYRTNAGTSEVVFSYSYANNQVDFRGDITVANVDSGKYRAGKYWDNSNIEGNAFYVKDITDGFGIGVGTDISTWFSYDSTNGVNDMISVQNDGSKVTIHENLYLGNVDTSSNSTSFLCLNSSGTLEVEKRTLGTGAFGPTPVGAYLPLTGGTLTGPVAMSNQNITGVNQLQINDPGEGVLFVGSTNVELYVIDDLVDTIVNFDNASEIRRDNVRLADVPYISSRAQQLMTNFNGLLGDNYNFPGFTFDGLEANSSPGSFKFVGSNGNSFTSEFMAVDAAFTYRMSVDAKSLNGSGRYYCMTVGYDVDSFVIGATNHMYRAGTNTTLAVALNPGDTTATLAGTGSNWQNGGTAGVSTHIRSFIIWEYTNTFGYTYPPETYSRLWYNNVWDPGNISGNVITLRVPWAGPAYPVGTRLSNGSAGGSYKYNVMSNKQLTTDWVRYTGVQNGIDYSGTNNSQKFAPGTAKIKMGWLMDYPGLNTETMWCTNWSVGIDTVAAGDISGNNNKVAKFGPNTPANIIDSNITDNGSSITLGSATSVSGILTVNVDSDSKILLDNAGTNASIIRSGSGQEMYFGSNGTGYAFRALVGGGTAFDGGGKTSFGTGSAFSTIQVGSNTFSGGNGMYADSRVGISNHGTLTGMMLASKYNDPTYPEYGLVFVQGPSTSDYNVWSISPDGPAKGSGLSFIHKPNTTNIHTTAPMMYLDGSNASVGIGTTTPASQLEIFNSGTSVLTLSHDGAPGGSSIDFNLKLASVSQPITAQIKATDDGAFRSDIIFTTKTAASGSSGLTERMRIDAAGSVGIGINPTIGKLQVQGSYYGSDQVQSENTLIGNAKINQGASTINTATLGSNSASVGIAIARDFSPVNYPDIIIKPDGKIGIKIDEPTQGFHVNSTSLFNGAMYFGSSSTPSVQIFNYGNSLHLYSAAAATINLGGGIGSRQNNVSVGNGYLTVSERVKTPIVTSITSGLILAAVTGAITIRPKGYSTSSGESTFDSSGNFATPGQIQASQYSGTVYSATGGALNPGLSNPGGTQNGTLQGSGSDTLSQLAVDSSGYVARGSQEATWKFTAAQMNVNSTTVASTLLSAPGAGKSIIVEDVWFMVNYTYNNAAMNAKQVYNVNITNQSGTNKVGSLSGTEINNLTRGTAASTQSVAFNSDFRAFKNSMPNQKLSFEKTLANSSLASSVTSVSVKVRYRVMDVNTF